MRTSVLILLASTLGGCASVPRALQGEFAPLLPTEASLAQQIGKRVRWGGAIVSVTPEPAQTCFEILSHDLDPKARPRADDDTSTGRFLACGEGFYDPAIFAPEREITVVGHIEDYKVRRIGEYDYRYPHVAAEVIYLWPERRAASLPYPEPFWPHYRPLWWGGYYIPLRVVPPRADTKPKPAVSNP